MVTETEQIWITVPGGFDVPESVRLPFLVLAASLAVPPLLVFVLPVTLLVSPFLFLGGLFVLPIGIAVYLLQKWCRNIDGMFLDLGKRLHQQGERARKAFEAGELFGFPDSPHSVIDDLVKLSDTSTTGEIAINRHARVVRF